MILGAKKTRNLLLSETWRTREVSGISWSKTKGLRTREAHVVSLSPNPISGGLIVKFWSKGKGLRTRGTGVQG